MIGTVRVSNSGRRTIFSTLPGRSWGLPDLRFNRYRVSFPGVNGSGSSNDHPPTFSAEVKERMELYV
jgi:hypothetical protein